MSKEMKPVSSDTYLAFTSFYGGKGVGECLQITDLGTGDYISVNREEALRLAMNLIAFANDEMEEFKDE